MSTAKRFGAALLHASAAATMVYGYNAMSGSPLDDYIMSQRCGHTQFLTIQAMAMAIVTMLLALGNDIFPSFRVFEQAKRTLAMVSLPLEVIVSVIYWALILFAPDLIVQRVPAASGGVTAPFKMRTDVDLALHAVPSLALTLDFVFFERKYSAAELKYGASAMVLGMALWYGSWVEYCGSLNDIFPYPFLTVNPFPIRVVIYLVVTMIALISLRIINSSRGPPLVGEIGPSPEGNGALANGAPGAHKGNN